MKRTYSITLTITFAQIFTYLYLALLMFVLTSGLFAISALVVENSGSALQGQTAGGQQLISFLMDIQGKSAGWGTAATSAAQIPVLPTELIPFGWLLASITLLETAYTFKAFLSLVNQHPGVNLRNK